MAMLLRLAEFVWYVPQILWLLAGYVVRGEEL